MFDRPRTESASPSVNLGTDDNNRSTDTNVVIGDPNVAGNANMPGSILVTATGILPGALVTLEVTAVVMSPPVQEMLPGNGNYIIDTQGAPGDHFSVQVIESTGLSCTVAASASTLGAQAVAVSVSCVRRLTLSQDQAANMVVGQVGMHAITRGGGTSGLLGPRGVGASPLGGYLYISDTGNTSVAATQPTPAGGSALSRLNGQLAVGQNLIWAGPRRISFNAAGTMAVADVDANLVAIYRNPPGPQDMPTVVLGGGPPGVGQNNFNGPNAAFLTANRMLVADRDNNRVLVYFRIPADNTDQPSMVLGQYDFNGSAFGCTGTTMSAPEDVWSDGNFVAVADSNNNRVLVWNNFPTTSGQSADLVLGQTMTSFNCSPGAGANQMHSPSAVIGDSATLYVADSNNNRVLLFPLSGLTGAYVAPTCLGQLTTSSTAANQAGDPNSTTLNFPAALGFYNTSLVVADTLNNRVLLYQSQ